MKKVNVKELEVGAASIKIDLHLGQMNVNHGTEGHILHSRKMYKDEWDELWYFLRKDELSKWGKRKGDRVA